MARKKVCVDGRQLQLIWNAMVVSYDVQALERDLLFALDRRLEAIVDLRDDLRNVAFKVLTAAMREGWLEDLLCMFKECIYPEVREVARRTLDQYPEVREVARRTLDQSSLAPQVHGAASARDGSANGDPYLSHLAGQRPFIDRSVLRTHLKDLLSGSPRRVLMITGQRPCGKSYTWFYARQPELLEGMTPVLVDLSEFTDPSLPVDLMSSIAVQLGLPPPTVDKYAQGAAQARYLRDWLVGQLLPRNGDGRWLLVFDSLDHVAQRDETLQLIEYLAGAAIRDRLTGLRVILLGYANRLPIDLLDSVLTEEIKDIGEPELREFFRSLARRVKLAMSDGAIEVAVNDVLRRLPDSREQRLRQLPKVVREVGNTAFGTEVLP